MSIISATLKSRTAQKLKSEELENMKISFLLALFLVSIAESFQVESDTFTSYKTKRAIPVSASILSNFAKFQGIVALICTPINIVIGGSHIRVSHLVIGWHIKSDPPGTP